jgi:hypothetical protein
LVKGVPFGVKGIPFELEGVPFGLEGVPSELKGIPSTLFWFLKAVNLPVFVKFWLKSTKSAIRGLTK